MKLTKEQYDALPPELKKLFTKDGDNYTMEQPEDTGALKRALEREREDKQKLKDDLKLMKDDLASIKTEKEEADRKKATDSKDIDAINASWQKKVDKITADKDAVIASREGSLRQLLVTNEAQRLANEMATAPDLLVPFIERRLQADFSQDGKATTRVLDPDGKLSALSLVELQKEMLADKRFSSILKASNASGGGASGGAGGGGASNLKAYRNADGTTNWSKVNEGMKTNPELLQQIKEFNADPGNTP